MKPTQNTLFLIYILAAVTSVQAEYGLRGNSGEGELSVEIVEKGQNDGDSLSSTEQSTRIESSLGSEVIGNGKVIANANQDELAFPHENYQLVPDEEVPKENLLAPSNNHQIEGEDNNLLIQNEQASGSIRGSGLSGTQEIQVLADIVYEPTHVQMALMQHHYHSVVLSLYNVYTYVALLLDRKT